MKKIQYKMHLIPPALLILLTIWLSAARCTTKTSVPSAEEVIIKKVEQPSQEVRRILDEKLPSDATKNSVDQRPGLPKENKPLQKLNQGIQARQKLASIKDDEKKKVVDGKPTQKNVSELAQMFKKKDQTRPLLQKPTVTVKPSIKARQENVAKIIQGQEDKQQRISNALEILEQDINRANSDLEAIAPINNDILRYISDLDEFNKSRISVLQNNLRNIRTATNPHDLKAQNKVNAVGQQFSNLKQALTKKLNEAKKNKAK